MSVTVGASLHVRSFYFWARPHLFLRHFCQDSRCLLLTCYASSFPPSLPPFHSSVIIIIVPCSPWPPPSVGAWPHWPGSS
jgi:hypothetical protein